MTTPIPTWQEMLWTLNEDGEYPYSEEIDAANAEIAALRAEVERLGRDGEAACKAFAALTAMYTSIWDRVDGAILLMPDRVPEFEKRHAAAVKALTKFSAALPQQEEK